MPRVLGLIPARGGSKRLPSKNMKELCGQPLIYWTIKAAMQSKLDKIVVSSDNDEILEYASTMVEVRPRPLELASDLATSESVVRNIMYHYPDYDMLMLLQPTSPLRTTEDIDFCIDRLFSTISVKRLGDYYIPNGAIYLMDYDKPMEYQMCYVMPESRSVDIDTVVDFDAAEERMLRVDWSRLNDKR